MTSVEQVAHAILKVVGENPGRFGRLRTARIIGGYPLVDPPQDVERYAIEGLEWPIRDVVACIDAMIDGGLVTQTIGQRPCLCLTIAGFRALEALEGGAS